MTQHTRSSTSIVRRTLTFAAALAAGAAAFCSAASPAAAEANACPSDEDGFYIRVIAQGEGVAKGESRRAAEADLVDRISFLADALGMEHSSRIVVGITDVTMTPAEGDDLITVTAASWLFVNESEGSLISVKDGCRGPATRGVIQEYDMDKYWL